MTDTPTILVIDDDPLSRQIIKAILGKSNNYVEAGNGSEGLEQLTAHPEASLVLLDLDMPETDGYQFLKYYQTSLKDQRKVYIAITSCTGESTFRTQALRENIDLSLVKAYLQKPFNMMLLRQSVVDACKE